MTNIKLFSNVSLFCSDSEILKKVIVANTFENPQFINNELNRRSNWNTPDKIKTYRFEEDCIVLPRGYMRDLLRLSHDNKIDTQIVDERISKNCPFPAKLNEVVLRLYQQQAVDEAMKCDQGVIVAPTGSGKSILGLEIIRRRQQKSLIIVHRSDLARQWIEIIKERLGITAGLIGDAQWEIGEQITLAMIQTLSSREKDLMAFSELFGLVLVDEVHHVPSATFANVISYFPAKYRYGLSATVERRDGLENIIYRHIGPALISISRDEVENVGSIVPATVQAIETGFSPCQVYSWNDYLSALTTDADRNLKIIQIATSQNKPTLILTDRIAHAGDLSEMLARRNIDHVLAHGQVKDRASVMEKIKSAQITVATTSLIGEGIDVSSWTILIMASPISSETKLLQAIGRVVRPAPGKQNALIYDLRDDCGFSGASFKKRFEIYKKHNIWVLFDKNKKAARVQI